MHFSTSTSRFTELFDSSSGVDRGDAGRVTEYHLRRGGRTDAFCEMEKGSCDRSDTGRQSACRQKCLKTDRHQGIRQLHVHSRQRSGRNWRDHNGEGSMFVSSSEIFDISSLIIDIFKPFLNRVLRLRYRGLCVTNRLIGLHSALLCFHRIGKV